MPCDETRWRTKVKQRSTIVQRSRWMSYATCFDMTEKIEPGRWVFLLRLICMVKIDWNWLKKSGNKTRTHTHTGNVKEISLFFNKTTIKQMRDGIENDFDTMYRCASDKDRERERERERPRAKKRAWNEIDLKSIVSKVTDLCVCVCLCV